MDTLVERNTGIPFAKSKGYTTSEDDQTSVDILVYTVGPAVRNASPHFEYFILGI